MPSLNLAWQSFRSNIYSHSCNLHIFINFEVDAVELELTFLYCLFTIIQVENTACCASRRLVRIIDIWQLTASPIRRLHKSTKQPQIRQGRRDQIVFE